MLKKHNLTTYWYYKVPTCRKILLKILYIGLCTKKILIKCMI